MCFGCLERRLTRYLYSCSHTCQILGSTATAFFLTLKGTFYYRYDHSYYLSHSSYLQRFDTSSEVGPSRRFINEHVQLSEYDTNLFGGGHESHSKDSAHKDVVHATRFSEQVLWTRLCDSVRHCVQFSAFDTVPIRSTVYKALNLALLPARKTARN